MGKAGLPDQESHSLQDGLSSKGRMAILAGDDSCREDSKGCMAIDTPAHLSHSDVPHPVLWLDVLRMRWRWQLDAPQLRRELDLTQDSARCPWCEASCWRR